MKKIVVGLTLLMCIGLAVLMTGTEDTYATSQGSEHYPLSAVNTDAKDFATYSDWYVLVGSSVSVTKYDPLNENYEETVQTVTTGFGLAFSGTALSGTLSAVGDITATTEWSDGVDTGNNTVIIHSVEQPYKHTVRYDSDGGTGSMPDTVVWDTNSGNTNVTLANCTFTREGYSFAGWDVNGSVYDEGDSVAVSGSGVLIATAVWSMDHGTALAPLSGIDTDAKVFLGDSTQITTDNWYVLPESYINIAPNLYDPTMMYKVASVSGDGASGFVVTSGYLSGTMPAGAGGLVVTIEISDEIGGNTEYIQNYILSPTPYYHTITYYANGGTGTMEDTTVYDANSGSKNVALAPNGYSLNGYIFGGWLVGGTVYQPGESVSVEQNSTVTATAQWLRIYAHTITYDANGGTGTMADTIITDNTIGNTDVTLAPNGFTYTGYTFAGWSVNNVIYQPNTTVPVAGNSTVTAIAQWNGEFTHTITYDANGGTGTMEDTVVIDTVSGNTNVTLAPNGFTYADHNFTGWMIGLTVYQAGESIPVGGNATVNAIAQWETIYTHTISYLANGGTGTMEDTVVSNNVSGDTNVTLAPNGFTYVGRTFAGWKVGTTIYQPGESVAVAGNVTVNATAQWTVTYTHTITYYANGGTGTMEDTVISNNVSGSTNVTLANCTYTRTGYTFTGWLVSGILRQVGDEIPVNGNATVSATAQWSQNTLTASVNNIIGYSEGVYNNQISATASTGGVLSYEIASVTGGTASVNASGLVIYTAPQVNASQVYTIAITVTATFPSTETVVRMISFTASIDPTPIGVTIDTGIAQKEVDQTPEGYYVDDIHFNDMDVTVFIGPQYTETETDNIMDDVPQVRSLVGIIPILMIAGIVAYVAHSMRTSRR